MDISNINASNAYTANESAKPPVDSSLLKAQDQAASKTTLKQNTERQQAFEVTITQEAQDRLAAETLQSQMKTPASENDSSDGSSQIQSPSAAQEARQIVNIVA